MPFKTIFFICFLSQFFFINSYSTYADEDKRIIFSIPNNSKLLITIPAQWNYHIEESDKNPPFTIIFDNKEEGKNNFKLIMSIFWIKNYNYNSGFNSKNRIRYHVSNDGYNVIPYSVDKYIALKEINGKYSYGYYYSLTYKKPMYNKLNHLTSGALGIGTLLINFNILTDKKDSLDISKALIMIKGAYQN